MSGGPDAAAGSRQQIRHEEPPGAEQSAGRQVERVAEMNIPERRPSVGEIARWSFVATLVVGGTVVLAFALWTIKLVVALLFLAFTIAAAMRPGVEALQRRGVPRAISIALHYLVVVAAIGALLAFGVPRALSQVQAALDQSSQPTRVGSGAGDRVLKAIDKRLHDLPSGGNLIHPAVSAGEQAAVVILGIFFTFASAAYWIYERDKAVDFVTRLMPRPKRKKVRDTWDLIDAKLGAFIRGQLLLVAVVAIAISTGLWLTGEPYWLLIGVTSGLLEIVPVIGPLLALALAVAAGLTVSPLTAALAAGVVIAVRLLQDYLVTPRVLGGAVGLSPLIVLVSVTATGLLLGGFYVLLAIPLAAAVGTVVDVVALGLDPADAETPTVLLTPSDAEV